MSEPELALIIFFLLQRTSASKRHICLPKSTTCQGAFTVACGILPIFFNALLQVRVTAKEFIQRAKTVVTICHFLNFLRRIHCCIFWLKPVMIISANILSKLHFDFQGQIFVVFFDFCKSPSSGKIFRNKNTCTVLKN